MSITELALLARANSAWPDHRVADRLVLTADGRIIDFLDRSVTRADMPEERVRQNYARTLFYQYGYSKSVMVLGAPINIGSEPRQADIVVYHDELAAKKRDQARIRLIVETKAPNEKSGVSQLKSYIFARGSRPPSTRRGPPGSGKPPRPPGPLGGQSSRAHLSMPCPLALGV